MAVGFIWSHCHRCGFRNKLGRGVIKRAPVARSTRDRRVATTEPGDPPLSPFWSLWGHEIRDLTFVFEINEHTYTHIYTHTLTPGMDRRTRLHRLMSPAVGPFVLASRLETLAKLGNKRSFFCSSGLRLRDTAAVQPILVIFGNPSWYFGIQDYLCEGDIFIFFFFFLFENEVSKNHARQDRQTFKELRDTVLPVRWKIPFCQWNICQLVPSLKTCRRITFGEHFSSSSNCPSVPRKSAKSRSISASESKLLDN